jgi:hypothetical protein
MSVLMTQTNGNIYLAFTAQNKFESTMKKILPMQLQMCKKGFIVINKECKLIDKVSVFNFSAILKTQIIPCLSYCPAGIMVISMRSRVKQFI